MKFSAFFRNTWHHFADYTSVSGFGQIHRSSHLVESLFWLVSFILCVYLTVRDCATPIVDYINEASISTIDILYLTDSVQFPGASICVQVNTSELTIRNFSALEDERSLDLFSACLQNTACFEGEKFFENFSDQIFASAKILSVLSLLENGVNEHIEATKGSLDGIPELFYQRTIGTSGGYLAKSIGHAICSQMKMTVAYWRKGKSAKPFDLCSLASLVWFGVPSRAAFESDQLCYSIANFTKFQFADEKYELVFYPRRLLPTHSKRTTEVAYFSVDSTPVKNDDSANYIEAPFDRCFYVEIDLVTRITMLSKRGRPCEATRSFFECYGRCSVQNLAELCGCESASWALYITDAVVPNISCLATYAATRREYERCSREAYVQRTACTQRCIGLCEKNIISLVSSECASQYPSNATSVVYSFYRGFYPHLKEQLQYDVPALVSNLGGIVGLWLGAGLIGILEALLFLPKLFAEYAVLLRAKKTETNCGYELHDRVAQLEAEVMSLKLQKPRCELKDAAI